MPFTRDPLDYPINRLLLKVGMLLNTWLIYLPPVKPSLRSKVEAEIAEDLELDKAIEIGLIKGYYFHWRRNNTLRTIHIVPDESVRRTPGIKDLKNLFFYEK